MPKGIPRATLSIVFVQSFRLSKLSAMVISPKFFKSYSKSKSISTPFYSCSDCNFNGTDGNLCEAENGRCPCKENFAGDFCDRCAEGYYGPDCLPCECDPTGSVHNVCDANTGQCLCNPSFDDKHCDSCKDGYHSYPSCLYSNCDSKGTIEEISDKISGECLCAEGYGGSRCDQCLPTYYNYPDCVKCNCSTVGSAQVVCGHDGKCPCLNNFAGKQCTQCSAGYYQYPECLCKYLCWTLSNLAAMCTLPTKKKNNKFSNLIDISQHAIVVRVDQTACPVMLMVNAPVMTITMEKLVTLVKKDSTIIPTVR